MNLPEKFLERVQEGFGIEGFDVNAFMASYEDMPHSGLRLNTMKVPNETKARELFAGTEAAEEVLGDRVPWTEAGFYMDAKGKWTRNPLYFAGLYYIQEPSAMSPAEFLPVEPGHRVLDLCAAPGGKSTRLAERLHGEGFLVANDASASRAKALLKNLEVFGAGNIMVTAEFPEELSKFYTEGFDRILVDAPCSGEGMFRKSPALVKAWEQSGPDFYAPLQRRILAEAVKMLAPGGYLLYSTCTFSRMEDEENALWLLREHEDMEVVPLSLSGRDTTGFVFTEIGARLLPHCLRGEGHYLCLFHKKGEAVAPKTTEVRGRRKIKDLPDIFKDIQYTFEPERFYQNGGSWYYLPEGCDVKPSLRYLRTGLYLGEEKKGRFEPSQSLAMWMKPEQFANRVMFDMDDERIIRYLKGETIDASGASCVGGDGWCLVCMGDFSLGFAKRKGTQLKNKYHTGWRWQ